MKAEIVAKKGQRERIVPEWDFRAWRHDTDMLSPSARGIWLDWLDALYDPAAEGRLSLPILDWARIGRCTVEEAKNAVKELRRWGVCDVKSGRSKKRRGHSMDNGADMVVDITARRVLKAYKRREYKRLHEAIRRGTGPCGQERGQDRGQHAAISGENGAPTVRKKALGKDRSISRNEEKDFGKASVSDSGETSTRKNPEPIPNPIEKEHVWSHGDPVALAAAICGEPASKLTYNTFRRRWKAIGDRAFRQELDAFLAELNAGEEPARRGKALTARLTALMESAKIRKAAEESLAMAAKAKAPTCRHCRDTGTIRDVPVPEGDFTEGGKRDLPCGFCLAGTREMERAGMPPAQQQELVRHEMEALKVAPEEFAGRK